jgi:hypothetical protein
MSRPKAQYGDLMSTILQTKSSKPGARERVLQTVYVKDGVACEQSQTDSGKDDDDARILLMQSL